MAIEDDLNYSHKCDIRKTRFLASFCLFVCFNVDVEPLGSEWSIEALLRFQTLVDGETLSARVLSVSERGYNVKLESRGQDVAATLISEHLAKAPGAVPKDTYVTFNSEAKRDEKIEESEDCTVHVEAPNHLGAISKETATKVTAIKAEGQLDCRCPED